MSSTPAPHGTLLFHDTFRDGLRTDGPRPLWHTQDAAGVEGGDGIARTSPDGGLRVVPTGTHPRTGAPAFVSTTGQQADGGQGTRDHVKWTAMPTHTAKSGFPGFDVCPGGSLVCTVTLSATTFGTEDHPFGAAVADPEADPRLACGSMIAADVETASIFGFFVTNKRVHANYERLRMPGTTYAAYTHAVPVAERTADSVDTLRITLNRSRSTVTWEVNGDEVLSVGRIGHPLRDRTHMLLDHGGVPEDLSPRQLVLGVGMFTLLDGALGADGTGLVQIDSAPGHYADPRSGSPTPQKFLDHLSAPASRLWGQGVELNVREMSVRAA